MGMRGCRWFVTVVALWLGLGAECRGQDKGPAFSDELPAEASARLGTLRFRHADGFHSLTFTPDGRHLVSGGWGGACLWDAKTGQFLRRLGEDLPNPGDRATLSRDGKLLAIDGWGQNMGGGGVYDFATGRRLYRFGSAGVSVAASLSPDGKVLAFAPRSDFAIVLLDAATGKEVRVLKGHDLGKAFAALSTEFVTAFTPDSKVLVSGCGDGTIRFWSVASGQEQRRIDVPEHGLARMALAPDGRILASVSRKKIDRGNGQSMYVHSPEVCLWDTQSGKEMRRLVVRPLRKREGPAGNEYGPSFIAFTPASRELVTGGGDGSLRVWDPVTGEERRRFDGYGSLRNIAFGPNGMIALIENHSIRLCDFVTGRDLAPTPGHRAQVGRVAVSPDGRTVASRGGYDERWITLWDAETGQEKRRLTGEAPFGALLFAQSGKTLFALSADNSLWMWDPLTGSERRRVKFNRDVSGLALAPDGKTLAVGGWDQVALLDATDGKELAKLTGADKGIAGFDFTPDGRALLAWTSDGRLHRWDTKTARHESREFYALEAYPFSVVFSPDGRVVTFGVQNSDFLPVVDVTTGREVCRFELVPQEDSQNLCWVAFAPDSRSLAWGGRKDGRVWLGELASGGVRHQLSGHRGRVQALAWSADGKRLITGSADTTALIWKLTGLIGMADADNVALSEAAFASYWTDLRGPDAKRAYAAMRRLVADPSRSIGYLSRQLVPAVAADPKRVAALIANLGDPAFATRDKAARELQQIGETALPALRQALAAKPSVEAQRRLDRLITQIEVMTPDRLQAIRAVEALELMPTAETVQILRRLAKGASEARLTREARESLARLNSH